MSFPIAVPSGLSPLLVGLLLLAATSCSDPIEESSGPGESQSVNGVPGVTIDDATQQTLDDMFGPAAPDPEPVLDLPKLDFQVLTAGLPTGGTWREHPTLHDFTGDGRDDLVASNREEDGLNAWFAPEELEAPWELRIEGLPRDMMYGGSDGADLDGDGDQDLVFVAHSEGVRVFLNDGEMNWTQGASLPNPFLMVDVALGDLDGDGRHDAVGIGHFNGGVGVYLGDGAGGFRRLDESAEILPSGVFGTQVELADIDGDGLDDIATCTNKGAKVFYTRKDEASGKLAWVEGSRGLPVPEIGNALRGLVPADFTGDGKLELAFCALADPGVPEEQRNDCGVFRQGQNGLWIQMDSGLPRGPAYQDLAVADFDKDGKMDLVLITRHGGAVMYLGNGEGDFSMRGALPDSRRGSKLAIGDVNADGWVDLAVQKADTKQHPTGGGLAIYVNGPEVWNDAKE